MDFYLAQIILFAGNFAQRGFQFCNGQILSIAQNTAVFSLLGTTYGGNGQTTFALPDLRGRAPIGAGQGLGLPNISLGEVSGTPTTTLLITNMPMHNHTLTASSLAGTVGVPSANVLSASPKTGSGPNATTLNTYNAGPVDSVLNPQSIGLSGGSQPFNNMQPYLGINYTICVEGMFPSRN
ncbi:phage tail protein [Pedobacter rhizosphaerae]|uniref:Microcystin-dependent protein n=1 Tax=Pedobacter rhizosphaerae TaxID=390241 RepID=A0A1H9TWV9_9SPHI|nr:tail fiber protein [Pedobacter rhizosphaerae]SES01253.1 Microcystin-dependent protein [Pedobacter rhizosphaerae]